MTFDYRMQPGLSSTHNAIALLEVLQFPPALIRDARTVLGMGRSAPIS
jgi:DNA mismatch repair ATPase MutS